MAGSTGGGAVIKRRFGRLGATVSRNLRATFSATGGRGFFRMRARIDIISVFIESCIKPN